MPDVDIFEAMNAGCSRGGFGDVAGKIKEVIETIHFFRIAPGS